jgi:ATP-dependent DNA helicase RecQ
MITHAKALLKRTFGHADFRPLQRRVIEPVLAGKDVLAVLPTGGGKSVCFQIPAMADGGLTLVVSPLIALMQDQVAGLTTRGIPAAALNGTLDVAEQAAVMADAAAGRLRLLYVSPERLPRAADELLQRGGKVARLAVDEAHCIAEWGHDFRPSYRVLRRARQALGRPPCVALTGSATPLVRREIREALGLGRDAVEVVGSFDRPNLRFRVVPVSGRDDRLAKLVVTVRTTRGAVVVYAPTRGLVEGLARTLVESGVRAAAYHAGLTTDTRKDVLEQFLDDRIRVVVATCAFGMGIDKPGVQLVAHWTYPATPESYYQEAGRAGRDGNVARCVLFHHPSDDQLPKRQIATTFPEERVIEALWRDPLLRARQPAAVVAAADRLGAELRPDRGRADWSAVRKRRRAAEQRLAAMRGYALTRSCRRAALIGWFGERLTTCAGCDRCTP